MATTPVESAPTTARAANAVLIIGSSIFEKDGLNGTPKFAHYSIVAFNGYPWTTPGLQLYFERFARF